MATDPTASADLGVPSEEGPLAKYPLLKKKLEECECCADCDSKKLKWASVNLGVFLCTQCSGVHRKLGVHITQVRSLTIDKWKKAWVEDMKKHSAFNAIHEFHVPAELPKPRAASSRELRDAYITAKYTGGCHVEEDGVAWTCKGAFLEGASATRPLAPVFDYSVSTDAPAKSVTPTETAMLETTGILFIRVVSAHKLPKADLFSASDPYVVFDSGHQQPKTEYIDNDNDPRWEPPSALSLTVDEKVPVRITIWDMDVFSSDDLLCFTTLRVDEECDVSGKEVLIEKTLKLDKRFDKKGALTPRIKFYATYQKLS